MHGSTQSLPALFTLHMFTIAQAIVFNSHNDTVK